jgi:hypothetical protein
VKRKTRQDLRKDRKQSINHNTKQENDARNEKGNKHKGKREIKEKKLK